VLSIQRAVLHAVNGYRKINKEVDKHEEEEVGERIAVAVESNERLPYLDDGGQRHVD